YVSSSSAIARCTYPRACCSACHVRLRSAAEPSTETKTCAFRRSPVTLTFVTVTNPTRGSCSSRRMISLVRCLMNFPIFSTRIFDTASSSLQDLDVPVQDLDAAMKLDVLHHLGEHAAHERAVRAHRCDLDLRALPQVLRADFGNRHVELVAHLI